MMTSNKQLQLAKWVTAILLIIGALSYIVSNTSPKTQGDHGQEPIRVVYKTPGGNVLFDHKTHTLETKHGLSCRDCHHHPSDEEEALQYTCNDCHVYPDKKTTIHPTCLDCHVEDEVEGVETNYLVDSTHKRGECIQCHKEFGSGPVTCESCHYK